MTNDYLKLYGEFADGNSAQTLRIKDIDGEQLYLESSDNNSSVSLEIDQRNAAARWDSLEAEGTFNYSWEGNLFRLSDLTSVPIEVDAFFTSNLISNGGNKSRDLEILPSTAGFEIEAWYAYENDYRNFTNTINGAYTISVDGEQKEGAIDIEWNGIGADVQKGILSDDLTELTSLKWHGNSSGFDYPTLIDETVNGVPIVLEATHGTFQGISM